MHLTAHPQIPDASAARYPSQTSTIPYQMAYRPPNPPNPPPPPVYAMATVPSHHASHTRHPPQYSDSARHSGHAVPTFTAAATAEFEFKGMGALHAGSMHAIPSNDSYLDDFPAVGCASMAWCQMHHRPVMHCGDTACMPWLFVQARQLQRRVQCKCVHEALVSACAYPHSTQS